MTSSASAVILKTFCPLLGALASALVSREQRSLLFGDGRFALGHFYRRLDFLASLYILGKAASREWARCFFLTLPPRQMFLLPERCSRCSRAHSRSASRTARMQFAATQCAAPCAYSGAYSDNRIVEPPRDLMQYDTTPLGEPECSPRGSRIAQYGWKIRITSIASVVFVLLVLRQSYCQYNSRDNL